MTRRPTGAWCQVPARRRETARRDAHAATDLGCGQVNSPLGILRLWAEVKHGRVESGDRTLVGRTEVEAVRPGLLNKRPRGWEGRGQVKAALVSMSANSLAVLAADVRWLAICVACG